MKSLLVVEDSPVIGSQTVEKLEADLEMPVVWTKTLAETEQILNKKNRPDFFAAILDFVLPDAQDGQIIDMVVSQGIPSIVFTASISEQIRNYVWSKKVVDYVLKNDPNCLDYIVAALKKLMTNQGNKILMVEDSLFFRKIISELLYIHQYKIIIADNGQEALAALEYHKDIKLVLTDFHMPGMDGVKLCQEIRKTHKKEDLAIIGISAEGNTSMAAQFIKGGANDFIVKQSFLLEEFYCRISQCIENIDLIRMTKEAAIKDFLTGLYNRRYFFDKGLEIFDASIQDQTPLACTMIDIDFFKKINDTQGHDAGDRVLKHLAQLLQDFSKESDLVARIGGEEFCILSGIKGPDPYKISAQRFNGLRERIGAESIPIGHQGRDLKITVSMGVSFNSQDNFDHMLKHADEQLYLAKANGRNQVALSAP